MDSFVSELSGEKPEESMGSVTSIEATAKFQASLIGGFVVRRDSRGRFATASNAVKFQAVKHRRRK